MPKLNLELPEKLVPVFDGPARFRAAYGGRGSAKSVTFADMACVCMVQEPQRFLFGRELQKSLKESVHSLLRSRVSALGMWDLFDIGDEYFRCRNGGEGIFMGLRSNAAEIKSMEGIKRSWIEEAQGVGQSSLDYLIPTLRLPNSEHWFTWNPDDEMDPVYDLLVTNKPDNAKVAEINYTDNPWFPEVLENDRQRDHAHGLRIGNMSRYNWIWLGGFNVNSEGAVYGKWMLMAEAEGRIVSGLYDPSLPVYTCWDFGHTDYTTFWCFQVVGGEVRWIDYYESNREGIQHYAELLTGYKFKAASLSETGKIIYLSLDEYPDGADQTLMQRRRSYRFAAHYGPHDSKHKTFAAGGRSIEEQFRDFSLKLRPVAALGQQQQIAVARKTIETSVYDREYCRDGIRALRKYKFQFDVERQRWGKEPYHDWASNGADSFELGGQVWKSVTLPENEPQPAFDIEGKSGRLLIHSSVLRLPAEETNKGEDRI